MDQVLQWFGEETYGSRLARVRAFWQGGERYLVSVTSSRQMYRQVFDDQKILAMAPENLRHQATLPGVNLPSFFADFGTVSTARYWGGATHFDSTGTNMFIEPVAQSAEESLLTEPKPIDDPQLDAARGLRLYRTICQQLQTDALWLRMPDVQGPLNTAALVVKQDELLMAMRTDIEPVRALVERTTDVVIDYLEFFHREAAGKVCGFIWPYTFFPGEFGASLTEDLMPLLSTAMYRELAVPYLKRLGEQFGALQIHCCGAFGRHAETLRDCGARLRALEFHYPFTKVHELKCLADTTVFVPYIALDKQGEFATASQYYGHLLKTTGDRFRYWFAWSDDSEEAERFAREHGF